MKKDISKKNILTKGQAPYSAPRNNTPLENKV